MLCYCFYNFLLQFFKNMNSFNKLLNCNTDLEHKSGAVLSLSIQTIQHQHSVIIIVQLLSEIHWFNNSTGSA